MQRDVLFPRGLFLVVLLHPGFPTPAGSSIASGERQRCDVVIGNGKFLIARLRVEPDYRIRERPAGAAVEDVTLNLFSAFKRNCKFAPVVESFLKSGAELLIPSQAPHPP